MSKTILEQQKRGNQNRNWAATNTRHHACATNDISDCINKALLCTLNN